MSANLSKAVGHQYESQDVTWNKRDLLLYAVGIGAKKDDFAFVYDKAFAAFPTYPVVMPFKLDLTDVSNFREQVKGRGRTVEGLPTFNPDRVVHGSQYIEIIKPIPVISGPGWKLERKLVGVHENKSGIVVDQETVLVNPQGEAYVRMFSSSFNVGAKAYGKPFRKAITAAPAAKPIPKDRKPSYIFTQNISEEQAIIYRLSGDYNPLHIEPAIGISAGFGGPILHGLATFGFVARGILSEAGSNDPTALKAFGARFTSPVKLGDKIETSVWEVGPGPNGTTELVFQTKNLSSGKLSLGAGIAFVKKSEKSKL
ncbi:peroxisomal dehydratase [Hysterangium stoloniferum]|nr:peroxisomal dehydratase [Hysterangium stoloniferum]